MPDRKIVDGGPTTTSAPISPGLRPCTGTAVAALPRIYDENAEMIVPQAAPVLLEGSYPDLTWEQRSEILHDTAGEAGNPLDWQGPEGSWQRLNLAAASVGGAIRR